MYASEGGGGDWVWISLATGAICTILGALSKTLSDVIKNWFDAKAKAKLEIAKAVVEEAKAHSEEAAASAVRTQARISEENAAAGRWQALYEEVHAERLENRKHVARQDAHIDELTREISRLRAEHNRCEVEIAQIYGSYEWLYDFCGRCAAELEKLGGSPGPVPPKAQRQPRPEARTGEAEFNHRQAEQNTKLLKAITQEVLTAPMTDAPKAPSGEPRQPSER